MNTIVIKKRNKNELMNCFGAACFIALGSLIYIFSTGSIIEIWLKYVSLICTLFFIVILCINLFKILDKTPGLILREIDFQYKFEYQKPQKMKWELVKKITLDKEEDVICIHLKNPDQFLVELSKKQRKKTKYYQDKYKTPFILLAENYATTSALIVKDMKSFLR